MSAVELALLSRILILFLNPARLLELLVLVIAAATCFERSLSNVNELLLSASCYHTSSSLSSSVAVAASYVDADF